MRSLSMFSRLLVATLSIIMVCVAVVSGLTYATLKDNSINSRMDALKTQARDIGYLAGRMTMESLAKTSRQVSVAEEYINWKSKPHTCSKSCSRVNTRFWWDARK